MGYISDRLCRGKSVNSLILLTIKETEVQVLPACLQVK